MESLKLSLGSDRFVSYQGIQSLNEEILQLSVLLPPLLPLLVYVNRVDVFVIQILSVLLRYCSEPRIVDHFRQHLLPSSIENINLEFLNQLLKLSNLLLKVNLELFVRLEFVGGL